MLLVHTTDLFRTALSYSCKRVFWLSRIAPEIGSTNERVALTGSRPNRRWTSALEVSGGLRRSEPCVRLQHLGGCHHVVEDWTPLHDLIGNGELVLGGGLARMDRHGVQSLL